MASLSTISAESSRASKTTTTLRVALVALGINSADELQPLICLARTLTLGSKGSVMNVAIVTHPQYREVLAENGVAFLDGGPCPFKARSTTAEGRALDSKLPRAQGEAVGDRLSLFMKVLTSEWFAKGQAALSDFKADAAILCSTGAVFVYPSICELSRNLRFAVMDNSPMTKTAEFGPPRGFGNSQAGFRWVNESRWDLHAKSMWSFLYRSGVNAARSKHALPLDDRELGPWEDVDRGAYPVLLAYSEVLLARPLEWGQSVAILGPLIDPDRTQPLSPPLLEFIEEGEENAGAADSGRSGYSSSSSLLVYLTFGEQFNSVSSKESRLKILSTCLAAITAIPGARAVVVCPPQCGVNADALRQQQEEQLSDGGGDASQPPTRRRRRRRCLVLSQRPTPSQEAQLWRRSKQQQQQSGSNNDNNNNNNNVVVLCSGDPWTLHAAVLSGVPLVCLDFGRDDTPEAFWGSRAFLAGVATEPVPVKKQAAAAAASAGAAPAVSSNSSSESGSSSLQASLETALLAVAPSESPIRVNAIAAGEAMRKKRSQSLSGACHAFGELVHSLAQQRHQQPPPQPSSSSSSSSSSSPGTGTNSTSTVNPLSKSTAGLSLSSPEQPNGGGAGGAKAAAAKQGGGAAAVEEDDGRRPAGFSFAHRAALSSGGPSNPSNVWRRGDDGVFRVRVGPNYKKNGRKAASGASLYELVHVDMFKSAKKMEGHSRVLRYPQVPRDTHHPNIVPALLVINGSLPLEAPTMLSPASDGPTLNALFYFAIKQSTCDALADVATAPSAVKLLLKWCTNAQTQPDVFARFKCIGLVRNYEEAGMPSMFKSFNGKPVLIRNREATKGGSGHLERGSVQGSSQGGGGGQSKTDFLEFNVNIRTWPYLAKQGLGYLMSGSDRTDLDVGFVLEGSSDEELPEVLLGSARLTKLKLDQVISWPDDSSAGSSKGSATAAGGASKGRSSMRGWK